MTNARFYAARSRRHYWAANRVSDLPAFSASVVPTVFSTPAESAYVCANIAPHLVRKAMAGDETETCRAVAVLFRVVKGIA